MSSSYDDEGGRPDAAPEEISDTWGDLTGAEREARPAVVRGGAARELVDEATSERAVARVRGVRALVVGENAVRVDAVANRLRELGVDATVGDLGDDGYRRALALWPDVVLSDLTAPTDPGWWLFQRFRRHPMLRWTPVLLMRWWEETEDGREKLLIGRVVERLAEALAPVRILEERISAGRALGERVESTGVPALMRLLAEAGLSGVLSINDSWNVFEAHFDRGNPRAVLRTGVDGSRDEGPTAFLQLLLCDAGRWSFRSMGEDPREANLEGGWAANMERASTTLADWIGPDAGLEENDAERFQVRIEAIRDVASSISGAGRELLEAVAAGASPEEIDVVIGGPKDIVLAERAVIVLLRNGALAYVAPGEKAEPGDEGRRRVARSAAHLLSRIAGDHRSGSRRPKREEEGDEKRAVDAEDDTGFYRVSQVKAERVALRAREGLIVPGARSPSMAADLDSVPPPAEGWPRPTPTPLVGPDEEAFEQLGRRSSSGGPGPARESYPAVLPRDSLVPAPNDEERQGRRQRWVAIGLALLLGCLIAAGLYILGSDPDRFSRPAQGSLD
jgi:CheY-like chemotaxis protein